jgi:hypothetical protein
MPQAVRPATFGRGAMTTSQRELAIAIASWLAVFALIAALSPKCSAKTPPGDPAQLLNLTRRSPRARPGIRPRVGISRASTRMCARDAKNVACADCNAVQDFGLSSTWWEGVYQHDTTWQFPVADPLASATKRKVQELARPFGPSAKQAFANGPPPVALERAGVFAFSPDPGCRLPRSVLTSRSTCSRWALCLVTLNNHDGKPPGRKLRKYLILRRPIQPVLVQDS